MLTQYTFVSVEKCTNLHKRRCIHGADVSLAVVPSIYHALYDPFLMFIM